MRAIVCYEFGSPANLQFIEMPAPEVAEGEVLVETHAVGVNFTDVLAVAGRSQLKRGFPFGPGVEAAGVIKRIGNSRNSHGWEDSIFRHPGTSRYGLDHQ